jgi:hypothetical protein
MQSLLGGDEIYHYHSKVNFKSNFCYYFVIYFENVKYIGLIKDCRIQKLLLIEILPTSPLRPEKRLRKQSRPFCHVSALKKENIMIFQTCPK